jgi:acyl-CoA thioesterase
MIFETIESAREFFYKDKFAVNTGITLDDLTDDKAICSLEITDDHKNAYGGVMGGVIFTLADFAFAVATNHENPNVVSLDSTINFLGIAKGKKIYAKAECVKDGRTTCVYVITITDEGGKEVARVTTTGYKFV